MIGIGFGLAWKRVDWEPTIRMLESLFVHLLTIVVKRYGIRYTDAR